MLFSGPCLLLDNSAHTVTDPLWVSGVHVVKECDGFILKLIVLTQARYALLLVEW